MSLPHFRRNLIFEGGGTLGVAYVGALKEAQKLNLISLDPKDEHRAVNFAGTSIGAAYAGLLACGASVDEIHQVINRWDASVARDSFTEIDLRRNRTERNWAMRLYRYLKTPFNFIRDLIRSYKRGGIWQGKLSRKVYAEELEKITGNRNITLQEIHDRYGTDLFVVAYCIDDDEPVYFNYRTHPGMPLVTGVSASMAVPGGFEWVIIDGKKHWDGGPCDNLPIQVFDDYDEETGERKSCNSETLAFKLVTDEEIKHSQGIKEPINNIADALPRLVNTIMSRAQRLHQHQCDFDRTVRINMHDLRPFNFDMTEEEKIRSIIYGRQGVRDFVGEREGPLKKQFSGKKLKKKKTNSGAKILIQ